MAEAGSARRRLAWAAAAWSLLAFAVWNGFFDILVTRGEKQYLLSQARHALGLGPTLTIHEIMSRTIADAVVVASIWAALVVLTGAVTTALVWRRARDRA